MLCNDNALVCRIIIVHVYAVDYPCVDLRSSAFLVLLVLVNIPFVKILLLLRLFNLLAFTQTVDDDAVLVELQDIVIVIAIAEGRLLLLLFGVIRLLILLVLLQLLLAFLVFLLVVERALFLHNLAVEQGVLLELLDLDEKALLPDVPEGDFRGVHQSVEVLLLAFFAMYECGESCLVPKYSGQLIEEAWDDIVNRELLLDESPLLDAHDVDARRGDVFQSALRTYNHMTRLQQALDEAKLSHKLQAVDQRRHVPDLDLHGKDVVVLVLSR